MWHRRQQQTMHVSVEKGRWAGDFFLLPHWKLCESPSDLPVQTGLLGSLEDRAKVNEVQEEYYDDQKDQTIEKFRSPVQFYTGRIKLCSLTMGASTYAHSDFVKDGFKSSG